MGFNFGGLIASAMKGAGEGGKVGAEYGMKLDMQKQLMEAQKDKDLAVDAIRRERDIAQVKPMAEAEAAAAPIKARAEADAMPIKTEAETKAAIAKTKALSEDPDYLKGTEKIQRSSKVVEREIATERANAIAGRGTGGGGGTAKAPYMKSKQIDEKGNVLGIMSDGSVKDLGIKSGDYNKQVSKLVNDMAKENVSFGRLSETEKRKKAEDRLLGSKGISTLDPAGLVAFGKKDPNAAAARAAAMRNAED